MDMKVDLPEIRDSIIDEKELAMCRRLLIKYKQSLGTKLKPTLSARIQALPQELQDLILHFKLLAALPQPQKLYFDKEKAGYTVVDPGDQHVRPNLFRRPASLDYHTFDAKGHAHLQTGPIPFSHVVFVDLSYQPSVALQINRRTRAAMAKVFYGNTVLLMKTYDCCKNVGQRIGCLPGVCRANNYKRDYFIREETHQRDFVLSLEQEHREMARVLWVDYDTGPFNLL